MQKTLYNISLWDAKPLQFFTVPVYGYTYSDLTPYLILLLPYNYYPAFGYL